MLDDALYADFMAECEEHLADIEEDILTMESLGAEVDIDLVNKTFRAIHSIKGGAGFLGLNAIQKLSHSMENLLDLMRTGQCVPDHDNCRLLLTGVDELKDLLANPNHGEEAKPNRMAMMSMFCGPIDRDGETWRRSA